MGNYFSLEGNSWTPSKRAVELNWCVNLKDIISPYSESKLESHKTHRYLPKKRSAKFTFPMGFLWESHGKLFFQERDSWTPPKRVVRLKWCANLKDITNPYSESKLESHRIRRYVPKKSFGFFKFPMGNVNFADLFFGKYLWVVWLSNFDPE